jgi:hypothetical protein
MTASMIMLKPSPQTPYWSVAGGEIIALAPGWG